MADDIKKPDRRKMSRAEAGRKGGNKTREKYGSDFFREIGRVGGSRGTTSSVRKRFGETTQHATENPSTTSTQGEEVDEQLISDDEALS